MKYFLLIMICIFGCKTNHKTVQTKSDLTDFKPNYSMGKPVMVYKTKNDYTNNVPVLLSDDKSEIVSYPHPNDLKAGSGLALPTLLNKGYLLDNRGINKNVAFLKMTYEQYAQLKNLLTLKEMENLIIDKDPLIELCDCGSKVAFTDLKAQLNRLIDNNKLRTTCRTIK